MTSRLSRESISAFLRSYDRPSHLVEELLHLFEARLKFSGGGISSDIAARWRWACSARMNRFRIRSSSRISASIQGFPSR